jgi:GR25 family glycosyltransferase involved in LPS biosynthesis
MLIKINNMIIKIIFSLIFIGVIISLYFIIKRFIFNENFEKIYDIFLKYKDQLDNIEPKEDSHLKINIPIYYINLERSLNRREYMEEQFNKFNITNYKRIEAIDGEKIKNIDSDTVDNNIKFINNYKNLKKNEVGCVLSHIKAIKNAYENNLEEVLILEDDCSLNLINFWDEDLKSLIKTVPYDWEIIQLYTINCIEDFNIKNKFILYDNKKGCWSSAAYLINRKGMKNILDYVNIDRNTIVLGNKIKDKLYPPYGAADSFIYNLTKTYYITIPLFYTTNDILESSIDSTDHIHNKLFIETANKIIKYYLNNY